MESDDALEKGDSAPLLRNKGVGGSSVSDHRRVPAIIMGVGCLESLAYFGISTNLVIFLGDVFHQSNSSTATTITTWTGTSFMAPLVGALLADSYCGGYWIILSSALIELLGMALITLSSTMQSSTTLPTRAVFFSGLYMVAVGSGGIKSSLLPLGADHLPEETPEERLTKSSFFNCFFFSLNLGALLSGTLLVWTEQNLGWTVGFAAAAAAMAAALVTFLSGAKPYKPSPIKDNPRAEDLKLLFLRLLPIWLTAVIYSAAYAQMYTTFVEQGKAMDGEIISSFRLPPATLFAFEVVSVMTWLFFYTAVVLPLAAPSPLARIGVGYLLMAAGMAAAAAVEVGRMGEKVRSMWWQIPQYFLVGGAEAFACVGQMEFFYGEAPEGMRRVGTAAALGGVSVGNYVSSAALAGVAGRLGWIPEDLREGHLGYLFSAVSGICLVNLVVFSFLARSYRSKNYC